MKTNKQIILASRPKGMPAEDNFRFVEMVLRAVGQVEESRHEHLKVGDFVSGQWGWQQYTVTDGAKLMKIDPGRASLTTVLGVLGMTGLTAYFGLLDIGKPQSGETVVVSGAAGAVGMIVGQIAKIYGCRVVGIAGSDEKISYLKGELGFDEGAGHRPPCTNSAPNQQRVDAGLYRQQLCAAVPGRRVSIGSIGGIETNPVHGNGGGRVRKYAESVYGPLFGGKHRQGAGEGFRSRVDGQKA